MEQFELKLGRCFALISNQLGDYICLLLGADIFLSNERLLSFINVMITSKVLVGALALMNSSPALHTSLTFYAILSHTA